MAKAARPVLAALSGGILIAALAAPVAADHNEDRHSANMKQLFQSPNLTGAVNSDLAFWGNRAYQGNYNGFRIFDISTPRKPRQIVDYQCRGPQGDPIVWKNRLLFVAVDSVLTGPGCNANPLLDPEDPTGWEGVRIFDVSNPRKPRLVKGVYTDCGAHTITLFPKNKRKLLIYVSSYPLRPGPTCGPVRGPEAGNSPLHEKIQVIRVPVRNPRAARVIAHPKISYPGDPDNTFDPSEHGLPEDVFNPLTACHDIGVFVELRLAAAACAEQAQLWRIKRNGIPATQRPLWVFDDPVDKNGATGDPADTEVAVDFWHSATFSWDGKIVNFIDESFGNGCPPVTAIGKGATEPNSDTGRMFFLDRKTGKKLSTFMLPREESAPAGAAGAAATPFVQREFAASAGLAGAQAAGADPEDGSEETAYCSAHLGNTVLSPDRRLLVNAWYMGGVDVIDFTFPRRPREVAYYDRAPFGPLGSDNWSAYWYQGPKLRGGGLEIYGTDGVHSPTTGQGFQVFKAMVRARERSLRHLNPQTQMKVLPLKHYS